MPPTLVPTEGETPLSWMLLTTEMVEDALMAANILRWYTYLWVLKTIIKF